MNVLSRDRSDHFMHLFVERRADLARALSPAAKIAATQEFRAALAEFIKEVIEAGGGRPSFEGWKETALQVGLLGPELAAHTDAAIEILAAINRARGVIPTLAALRKRAAP